MTTTKSLKNSGYKILQKKYIYKPWPENHENAMSKENQ